MIAAALLLTAAMSSASPSLDARQQAVLALSAVEHGRLLQTHMMLERLTGAEPAADPLLIERIRAKLAFSEARYGDARAAFEKILVTEPADCDALEGAGIAAARAHEDKRAQARLQQARGQCTLSWRAWNTLGVLADHAGQWMAAGDAYARARALAPREPAVLNNMGYSLILQGRYADALVLLRQARGFAPADQKSVNNFDVATVAAGRSLNMSGDNDGDRARRLNNAGYAAMLEGRPDEAREYLKESQRVDPNFSERTANNLRMAENEARGEMQDGR